MDIGKERRSLGRKAMWGEGLDLYQGERERKRGEGQRKEAGVSLGIQIWH